MSDERGAAAAAGPSLGDEALNRLWAGARASVVSQYDVVEELRRRQRLRPLVAEPRRRRRRR